MKLTEVFQIVDRQLVACKVQGGECTAMEEELSSLKSKQLEERDKERKSVGGETGSGTAGGSGAGQVADDLLVSLDDIVRIEKAKLKVEEAKKKARNAAPSVDDEIAAEAFSAMDNVLKKKNRKCVICTIFFRQPFLIKGLQHDSSRRQRKDKPQGKSNAQPLTKK